MAELDQVQLEFGPRLALAALQFELVALAAGLAVALAVELVQLRVFCPQRSFLADR